jgi:hypothetical protein
VLFFYLVPDTTRDGDDDVIINNLFTFIDFHKSKTNVSSPPPKVVIFNFDCAGVSNHLFSVENEAVKRLRQICIDVLLTYSQQHVTLYTCSYISANAIEIRAIEIPKCIV